MASRPALFDAWVAADPSLWWDGGVLVRMLEENPAAGRSRAPVYAGVGSAPRGAGGPTASRRIAPPGRPTAGLRGVSRAAAEGV